MNGLQEALAYSKWKSVAETLARKSMLRLYYDFMLEIYSHPAAGFRS